MTESKDVLNYVADMTYCGADAKWHFKDAYNPQRVLDVLTHPEAQGNKDLGEPAASGLEGKDDRLWALLRAEMEKFGLTYIGAPPTGKTRDESLMLAAMSAMRAWALLQAQRVAQAAPTSPQPIKGESELESASNGMGLR